MSANTGRYGKMTSTTNALREPGYLKAWVALKSDFTTLQEPATTGAPVLGDAFTIATDHTFAVGKEPIQIFVKQDTIEAPGESSGEIGSLRTIWKPKFFVKGDGAVVEEIINNLMNEELIVFVQDQCAPAKFIQFGCSCMPAEITKRTVTSGTLISGQKGNELEFRSFCKFFYSGTLPQRA